MTETPTCKIAKTLWNMIYFCQEPIQDFTPQGQTARLFAVSAPMHNCLREYAWQHLHLEMPNPQKEEILQLDAEDCSKIWKAMNTQGLSGVKEAVYTINLRNHNPSQEVSWKSVWNLRSVFQLSQGIKISRYGDRRNPSPWTGYSIMTGYSQSNLLKTFDYS